MAQDASFDIKILEGSSIQFSQEATYENFIGQFQQYCPKLICVIDGTSLHYYDKTSSLPTNVRFDYKQRRGTVTEYYFRDINDDTLYCVFGREAAAIFYPRINIVDSIVIPDSRNIDQEISNINSASVISRSNLSVNNQTNLLQHERGVYNKSPSDHKTLPIGGTSHLLPSDMCKPKRRPIIQSITPTIPLFREESSNINSERNKHSTTQYNSSIPKFEQSQPVTDVLKHRPSQIIIIDNGVKLTFPNPNYPVEVKTYYPS